MSIATEIPVSLFFDYSCPFCYVGSLRLLGLRERYPLRIRWRLIESQSGNPANGRPLAEREIEQRQGAVEMAAEDGFTLALPTFSPNTRRALLLAQACLDHHPDRFEALHLALFRAYLEEGRNLGDPEVLRQQAEAEHVADLLPAAWENPRYIAGLLRHVEAAQALELTAVPTLAVGPRAFPGAVSLDVLEQALQEHIRDA
jgi:predicted DsbA family dithiol-disulfide isomerase